MPEPAIVTELNEPQNISCHSPGHSVSSCLWGHSLNGTAQAIIIDEKTVANGGAMSVSGFSFAGDGEDLDRGDCTLQITNVTADHFGLWSCTLITRNSTVFGGAVRLGKPEIHRLF